MILNNDNKIKHTVVKADTTSAETVTRYNFNSDITIYGVDNNDKKVNYYSFSLWFEDFTIKNDLIVNKPDIDINFLANFIGFSIDYSQFKEGSSENVIISEKFIFDETLVNLKNASSVSVPSYGFDSFGDIFFVLPFIEQSKNIIINGFPFDKIRFNGLNVDSCVYNEKKINVETASYEQRGMKCTYFEISFSESVESIKEFYQIKFLNNKKEVINEFVVATGEMFTFPICPIVEHYKSSGMWGFDSFYYMEGGVFDIYVDKDFIFTAIYSLILYDLKFYNSSLPLDSDLVFQSKATVETTEFILPNNNLIESNTTHLIGWADSRENAIDGICADFSNYKISGHQNFFAVTESKYKIEFLDKDENILKTEFQINGEAVVAPNLIELPYYNLLGWADKNGMVYGKNDFSYLVGNSDMQFKLKYEPINYKFQFYMEIEGRKLWSPSWLFSYNIENNFVYPKEMFDYNNLGFEHKIITLSENQDYKNFEWLVENGEVGQLNRILVPVNVNVETEKFNVTFKTQFGDVIETKICEYGTFANFPTPPSVNGYTFLNWLGFTISDDKILVDRNREIVAQYSANEYVLSLVNEDNSIIKTYNLVYGNEINKFITEIDYYKKGYLFKSFSTDILNMTMPANNLNVICYYELEKYTVNFYYRLYKDLHNTKLDLLETKLIQSDLLTINDKLIALTKEINGYDFKYYTSWEFGEIHPSINDIENKVINKNIDIYLDYFLKEFRYSFKILDGGIVESGVKYYGDMLIEPEVATRDYLGALNQNKVKLNIKSWSVTFPYKITNDIEIIGEYEKAYDIEFKYYSMQRFTTKNGVYYDMITFQTRFIGVKENEIPNPLLCGTVPYENQIIYDSVPGFKFLNWDSKICSSTENKTYTAVYEMPKFKVKYIDRRGEIALEKYIDVSLVPIEELQQLNLSWDIFKSSFERLFALKFGEFIDGFDAVYETQEFYNAVINSSNKYTQVYFLLVRPNLDEDIIKGLFKDFEVDIKSRNLNYLSGTKLENNLIYYISTDNYMINGIDYSANLEYDALIYAPVNAFDSIVGFFKNIGDFFINVFSFIKNNLLIIVSCFIGFIVLCFLKPIRIIFKYIFRIVFFPFYLLSLLFKKNKNKKDKKLKEMKVENKVFYKEKKIKQNSYDKVTKIKSKMLEKDIKAKEKEMKKNEINKIKIEDKQKRVRQKSYKKLNKINKRGF